MAQGFYYKRVIPVLLLKDGGLYKTTRFKDPVYIGDPINAVKIFNEKEVDELIFLDIEASKLGREPDYDLIQSIANECFMPFCYGGGICTLEQIKRITQIGVEKVALNTIAAQNLDFVREAAREFASSTIVVSIDVRKEFIGGYKAFCNSGSQKIKMPLIDYAKKVADAGAGEILLHDVQREGTMTGYDLQLLESISSQVDIPIIACGGAATIDDLQGAMRHGAMAAAAGSLFVYKGKHKAVLINYPKPDELSFINS
jgi:imidazole glycerol-phosphate synthase subunit HisF